jgi:hypothetical protein
LRHGENGKEGTCSARGRLLRTLRSGQPTAIVNEGASPHCGRVSSRMAFQSGEPQSFPPGPGRSRGLIPLLANYGEHGHRPAKFHARQARRYVMARMWIIAKIGRGRGTKPCYTRAWTSLRKCRGGTKRIMKLGQDWPETLKTSPLGNRRDNGIAIQSRGLKAVLLIYS